MTAARRPVRRWGVASALAGAALAAVLGAAPTAAQEAPPPTAPTTTVATPPTTTAGPAPTVPDGAPTTTVPDTTTTTPPPEAGDPGAPPTTGADPGGDTTTTSPGDDATAEAPAAPAPQPAAAVTVTLDVAPGTLLVDGQQVGVTVTGVAPDQYVSIGQCAAGTEEIWERCAGDGGGGYERDPDGTIRARARLDAVLDVGGYETPARAVDCRVEPCTLSVEHGGDGPSSTVEVDLAFDPDAPLAPPPTATLSPAGPYAHGQVVTVAVQGVVWATEARLLQCPVGATSPDDCDRGWWSYIDLYESTSGSAPLALFAVLDTPSGAVDCRVAGACMVAVAAGRTLAPAKTAIVPVTFDPATEVVPPTLTVAPATGLVHGQTVTVTGAGFVPGLVQFSQCAPGPDLTSCRWVEAWAEPDATGAFTTQARVSAVVATPQGEIDCRTAPTPCVLVASPSGPDSPRAGIAELVFDPEAPLPPPPAVTVTPSTGLRDETAVQVTGTGFGLLGGDYVEVDVCRTGTAVCDEAAGTWTEASADGRLTTTLVVTASFRAWDGTEVDCRAEPGCEVRAHDGDGRTARAALSFGPPATAEDRYRLPVFDEVETTSDIVYRRTVDATGTPVDLTLDVVEPAGDTETDRPTVVWLSGGWFGPTAPELTAYAEDLARRGYVSVTMQYRARPGLRCCPTDDIEGVTAAVDDATDDAAAGVAWLRDHADELGIDPDLIAVGGSEGGATAAFGLAHVVDAPVAAVVPIAGVDFGSPDRGEPPFLAFHDRYDNVAPAHLSQAACTRASARGTACDTVVLTDVSGGASPSSRRVIVARTSAFLADEVLTPGGVIDPVDAPGGGLPAGIPAAPVATTVGLWVAQGSLPVTGVEVAHLAALALGLLLVGGAALAGRRAGVHRPADAGAARVAVVAAVAVVGLAVAAFGVTSALGPDDETAGGDPTADEGDDGVDHDAMDHDSMDHDATDHDAMDHDGGALGAHAVAAHGAGADHGHDDGAGGDGHDHGGGSADDHATGDHPGGDHGHPAGTPSGHGHPSGPGTPPHGHPGNPGGPHPPHEPEPPTGFDPDWTPEQVAFANRLIADTQAQLRRYDTLAILPLTGFQWITDGQQVDTYQHWIHISRIADPRRLDAAYPESLVLRTTPDGPVLEAAMYMLSLGYHLGNIPADIAWLPGWHIHDNLCFEPGFVLVGVTVNGRCERGTVQPTPPMIHVWREPTPCGWFAGVDEFGLQCGHEH